MNKTLVLLVDDEVPFVETMSKRLTKRELDVLTAFSGPEALKQLDEHPDVDVAVLGVKMPGMDGIETLREIKRLHPSVEVVMLTGYGTIESAIDGMKQGAFDFMVKPCDMDLLMNKIKEAKNKKTQHEQKIIEAKNLEIILRKGN
ncbi:MAG: response regulator [Deltaproteobacteria bacterium]|nr:response regulator [Deltaproteobacteria bacterium]MBF0507397.1 response regulator [Deltaproteobacteria bacterium]MBF0523774.1 response regulator [Deltaproteobacteria bacterium]